MGQNASSDRADEWGPTSAQIESQLRSECEDAKQYQHQHPLPPPQPQPQLHPPHRHQMSSLESTIPASGSWAPSHALHHSHVGDATVAPRLVPLPGLPPSIHPAMPPASSHSAATVAYLQRLLSQTETASPLQPHVDASLIRHQLDNIVQTAQRQQAEQQRMARRHMEELVKAQLLPPIVRDLGADSMGGVDARVLAAAPTASAIPIAASVVARAHVVHSAVASEAQPQNKKARRSRSKKQQRVALAVPTQVVQAQMATNLPVAQAVIIAQQPLERPQRPTVRVNSAPPTPQTGLLYDPAANGSAAQVTPRQPTPPQVTPLHNGFTDQNGWGHSIDMNTPAIAPVASLDHSFPSFPSPTAATTMLLSPTLTSPTAHQVAELVYRDYDANPIRSVHSPLFQAPPGLHAEDELDVAPHPYSSLDMLPPMSPSMFMAEEHAVHAPSHAAAGDAALLSHDAFDISSPDQHVRSPTPPMTTNSDHFSSASSTSVSSSSTSDTSDSARARALTGEKLSKTLLSNYLGADVLSKLEEQHAAGIFSAAAVRQYIMSITCSMEPPEQSEFLEQFTKLNLRGCEDALFTCPHVDLHQVAGLPCCPRLAPPGWGGQLVANMRMLGQANPDEPLATTPAQRQLLANGQPHMTPAWYAAHPVAHLRESDETDDVSHRIVTVAPDAAWPSSFDQDLSPLEPAPDDPDGIARVRLTMLFSSTTNRNKRRMNSNADEPSDPTTSTTSTTPDDTTSSEPTVHVHRSMQVNEAYTRAFGNTQLDVKKFLSHPQNSPALIYVKVRSDFVAACHRITTQWNLDGTKEGHMSGTRAHNTTNEAAWFGVALCYSPLASASFSLRLSVFHPRRYQVRRTRDGNEVYCLIHVHNHLDRGLLLGAVYSFILLPPDDPEHPPPPFVEGVDIDVDTVLYGYHPNRPHVGSSTTPATA